MSAPIPTELAFAAAFQSQVGGPKSRQMEIAITAWMHQESGSLARVIGNNPFNLRPGNDDAFLRSGTRPQHNAEGKIVGLFSVYPSFSYGYRAAAVRLISAKNDYRRYDRVVAAARRGDAVGFLNALASSYWDASRYGTLHGGPNHLLAVFAYLGGYGSISGGTVQHQHPEDSMLRYTHATSDTRMSLAKGQALFAYPGGPKVTAMSAAAAVPHLGLCQARPGGKAWRCVVVGTKATYADGKPHRTALYVPASAGKVA